MNTIKPSIKHAALMAMFLVGAGSAVAFQTHAQNVTPAAAVAQTSTTAVTTTPSDAADTGADIETNDAADTGVQGDATDAPESATDAADATDTPDAAGTPDAQD